MHKYSNRICEPKKRVHIFIFFFLVSCCAWNGKIVIGLLLPSSNQLIDPIISWYMFFGLPLMSATIFTLVYPIFYIGWNWVTLWIRIVKRHRNLQALEREVGEFLDQRKGTTSFKH